MTRETVQKSLYEGEMPDIEISPETWDRIDAEGGLASPCPDAARNIAIRALRAYAVALEIERDGCSPKAIRDELKAVATLVQDLLGALVRLLSNDQKPSSRQTARELARERLREQCPALDLDALIETLGTLSVHALEPLVNATKGRKGKNTAEAESICVAKLGMAYRLASGKNPSGHERKHPRAEVVSEKDLKRVAALTGAEYKSAIRELAKRLEETTTKDEIEREVQRYRDQVKAGDWQPEVYWITALLMRVPDLRQRDPNSIAASVANHLKVLKSGRQPNEGNRRALSLLDKTRGSKVARKLSN